MPKVRKPKIKRLAASNGHLAVALREYVREHAEQRPGVYRMIGLNGELVYVGKAVKLRSRLLSYFRADRTDKATEIISAVKQIEWEYVPSEFAALLLELRLIQRHRPLFNHQHKSDRAFCFIKVTREEAPRLLMATHVQDDGAIYYGPYRGRGMVQGVLREVRDVLELRDCKAGTRIKFADQMDLFDIETVPLCVRADLHKCMAPCAGRCTRTDYQYRVLQARRFIEGDVDRPLKVLYERMKTASQRMQFEYAALLRDRAYQLEGARTELLALRGTIEALSFIYSVPGYQGDDRVYIIRRGSIRKELPAPRTLAEEQAVMESARRILGRRERGPATVDPFSAGETVLISTWFRLRPDQLAHTRGIE